MEVTSGTVIAVDFDHTLCDSKYPECGEPIDYANENIPERIEQWGNDCRKISADYYIDDRAVELTGLL